jgi:hypothetical protein
VRDVEGGEAGAEWSVSGMEHGSDSGPRNKPDGVGRLVGWGSRHALINKLM